MTLDKNPMFIFPEGTDIEIRSRDHLNYQSDSTEFRYSSVPMIISSDRRNLKGYDDNATYIQRNGLQAWRAFHNT